MRIATWNIRAGGGKRTERIAGVILEESPDFIVLTEYRPAPGRTLLELLQPLAYHVSSRIASGSQNCVCVLSRHPIRTYEPKVTPRSAHRWVSVFIAEFDLTILGVHVPNQSEIWNKREFWNCIDSFASELAERRALIVGDLNTALDEDCEGDPIREAVNFKRLIDTGWVDAWRLHNPVAREFTWYSHRNNGFRLDHCLVSPRLVPSVLASSYRHDVRGTGLSDHSLLRVEIGHTS